MIRQALIALGLSAGAAHGQGMVPTAPILETCGGTRLVLEAEGDPNMDQLEQARAVLDRRMGGMLSGLFSYATVADDQIILSFPAGMAQGMGDLDSLLNPVSFGVYAVLEQTSEAVEPSAGQIVLPHAEIPDAFFVLPAEPAFNNGALVAATPSFDASDMPSVEVEFSSEAQRRLTDFTQENLDKTVAIVLNDEVIVAPIIKSPISGPVIVLTGNFTVVEVTEYTLLLGNGLMPFGMQITAEETMDGSDPSADFCP